MSKSMKHLIVRSLKREWSKVQSRLDLDWMAGIQIDEMAVVFRHEEDLEQFVSRFNPDEHFNSVPRDRMVRQDASGEFDVRFEFLQLPGVPWRIEAMCVLGGTAPLHQHLTGIYQWSVVHASFKLPDEREYRAMCQDLVVSGSVAAAEYRNSYGLFSYWTDRTLPNGLYLKPRVNLTGN